MSKIRQKNITYYDKMKKQHTDNLEIMRKQPHLDNKNKLYFQSKKNKNVS